MQKQVKFQEAIITKYPEQVIIAIAKDKYGKANPITLGWTMIASYAPPMMAIAVAKTHYSTAAIKHSKCFTIAYPSSDMADAALFFGSHSGRDMDKFVCFKCKTQPAKKIDSLLLADAVANFECILRKQIPAGDHIVFVGKIVASHINIRKKKRIYTVGPNHKMGTAN